MRARTTPPVLELLLNLSRANPTAITAWLTSCAPDWSTWGAFKGLEVELNNRDEKVMIYVASAMRPYFVQPVRSTQLANISHLGQICPLDDVDIQGRYAPYLYIWLNVAAWEPYNLHYLGRVSWVGSVLYRSCTTSCNGR